MSNSERKLDLFKVGTEWILDAFEDIGAEQIAISIARLKLLHVHMFLLGNRKCLGSRFRIPLSVSSKVLGFHFSAGSCFCFFGPSEDQSSVSHCSQRNLVVCEEYSW